MLDIDLNIRFDLHKMGWESFQHLVGTIFREIMGQTLSEFSPQHDLGRDFAYSGCGTSDGGDDTFCGNFAIQCKHTNRESKPLYCSTLTSDFQKIENLVNKGLADIYILVTNHYLTGKTEQNILNAVRQRGVKQGFVYGYEWLVTQIASHPKLRRLVPRLYGLGDLTQIVTNNAYLQARSVLDSQMSDLNCFVTTSAYMKSAKALDVFGFVNLIGEPASGKTTIASLLALSAADEWALQTMIISSPEEFKRLWNPNDPGQYLWVDDAFGTTQYDPQRVREWNCRLLELKSAIRDGARVVFTSRDYIFHAANKELLMSKFELFEEAQVTVYCENLSELEKSRMLYNHLKHGDQPKSFKTKVKPWLEQAVKSEKFLPETARRFGSQRFTKSLSLKNVKVCEFFDEPVTYLGELVSTLASSEQAALALIFCNGGYLATPVDETEEVKRTVHLMHSTLSAVRKSLVNLEGSMVRRAPEFGETYWCFKHPTIQDAVSNYVGSNPELIDVYLQGTTFQKVIAEVTCGVDGGDGMYINVPRTRYLKVMEKFNSVSRDEDQPCDQSRYFLASRCEPEFLRIYFSQIEDMDVLPDEIRSLSLLDGSLRVLVRLRVLGLLSDEVRRKAYRRIRYLTEDQFDTQFLRSDVAQLLSEEEQLSIVNDIREFVIEYGDSCIQEMWNNWNRDDLPEDLFAELNETLEYLVERTESHFALQKIEKLQGDIDGTIQEMEVTPRATFENEDWDWEAIHERQIENFGIFDDVDE